MIKSEWQVKLDQYNNKNDKKPLFFNTTLTPEDADYLLEDNSHNRHITDVMLKKLTREMKLGRWALNGECIVISRKGKLLNGQHRLTALKKHGAPVEFSMAITYNEPFGTIDMGKPRSGGDLLRINGYTNVNNHSAALRYLLVYQSDEAMGFGASIVPTDILEAIRRWPDIQNTVLESRKILFLTSTSKIQFLMYLFSHVDHEASLAFFYKLESGEKLAKSSPILHLRTMLLKFRVKKLSLDKRYEVASFFIAFNAFRNKERVTTVAWDGKNFPVLNGVNRKKLFQPH